MKDEWLEGLKSKVTGRGKEKVPNLLVSGLWISFHSSQAVAGSQVAHVAAAA